MRTHLSRKELEAVHNMRVAFANQKSFIRCFPAFLGIFRTVWRQETTSRHVSLDDKISKTDLDDV